MNVMSFPRYIGIAWLLASSLTMPAGCRAADTRAFTIRGDIVTDCGFDPAAVSFDLGDVEISSLPSVGSASNWVDGALVSTGCVGTNSITMALTGTADADDNSLFAVSGGAGGIGIELITFDGQPAVPNGAGVTWAAQPAGGTYVYRARYVRTSAPLQLGPATATITVSIQHE